LDTLSDSASRGADLIRQILSFARGTGEQFMDIQLRHLIREHERILKETLPRSIVISTAVPHDLWLVRGNPTQLSQVLMNLSVNARDAMPDGGQITIRARNLVVDEFMVKARPELKPGFYIVVSVSDTGEGIPASIIPRIFEPFFTTKDVTRGTGLGLATAQGIAKTHSGALTVSSEVNKGTQFDLYLPAVLTEAAVQVDVEKAPLPRGNGQCILVVDDEPSSLALLSATLQAYGYQVLAAANGAEGLKNFTTNQNRVALVLTDMAMPIMDGVTFIRALRALQPKLRILVLSGLVEHAASTVAALGNVNILAKPCSAEELLASVQRLLRG
jgi:CheY-like chemotaxis protein